MKKNYPKKTFLIILLGILVISILFLVSYLYLKNKPQASTTNPDYRYLQLVDYGGTPQGDIIQTRTGIMSWWQLPSKLNYIKTSGTVDYGTVNSSSCQNNWLGGVSIYPYNKLPSQNINLKICASDFPDDLVGITDMTNNPICKNYNFVPLDGNPWTFRFSPSNGIAKGKFAKVRLVMFNNLPLITTKIPIKMSLEMVSPTYMGLVNFSSPNIVFYGEQSSPQLMAEAAADLGKMAQDYKSQTGQPLPIISGFRTQENQRSILNDPSSIGPAGICGSWHEAGLAVDLKLSLIGEQNYNNIIKVIAPRYNWTILNPIWREDNHTEDHHLDYTPGQNYFDHNVVNAINAANCHTACPQ